MKLKVYWDSPKSYKSFWSWLFHDCVFQTSVIYDGPKRGYFENPNGMQWMASTRICGLSFDRYYKIRSEE